MNRVLRSVNHSAIRANNSFVNNAKYNNLTCLRTQYINANVLPSCNSQYNTLYNTHNRHLHNLRPLNNIKQQQQCAYQSLNVLLSKRYLSTVSIQQLVNNTKQKLSDASQLHYIKPSQYDKQIGIWLFSICGIIFIMVTLGGVTRLTRSGLSMTEWKLTDPRLPTTVQEWQDEFDKYKQTPEYKLCNSTMTLGEFKTIYYYEYSHRLLGRIIGIVFAGPLLYFIYKRRIDKSLGIRLSSLFVLGGMQGMIGWWYVQYAVANQHI